MSADRDQVIGALPGYELGGELGRGAWGVVLAAEHRQLGRQVAVKQLPREFSEDLEVRRRFVSEARLLASLDHPNVVPVYDYVERDGVCLLIMERLTGGTLRRRFRAGGLTAQAACGVVVAACAGLHHAHLKGVLHRDVKPENLMFSSAGALKVTDFGIAKVVGGASTIATKAGYVVGTPAYIAPEQVTSAELSPATDVYAAGLVLFELLSGALPFPAADDPVVALYQHAHEDPARLREVAPYLPSEFDTVTARALARDPNERFASAQAFGSAIAEAATTTWGESWWSSTGIELHRVGASAESAATTRRVPTAVTVKAPGASAPRRRSPSRRLIAAAATGLAAVGLGVAVLAGGGDGNGGGDGGGGGATTAAGNLFGAGVSTTGSTTAATPEALRVAKAWFAAFDSGDDRRAASYFVPNVNANGNLLKTQADAETYLSAFGCSGRVSSIQTAGPEVTLVIERQRQRVDSPKCDARGQLAAFGIRVRDGKIVDWD